MHAGPEFQYHQWKVNWPRKRASSKINRLVLQLKWDFIVHKLSGIRHWQHFTPTSYLLWTTWIIQVRKRSNDRREVVVIINGRIHRNLLQLESGVFHYLFGLFLVEELFNNQSLFTRAQTLLHQIQLKSGKRKSLTL